MPLAARILFGVCGAILALYAAASLSGNWLSTPPWWEQERAADLRDAHVGMNISRGRVGEWLLRRTEPREGRELISVGVGAVGLAALAFAALARRQPGSV